MHVSLYLYIHVCMFVPVCNLIQAQVCMCVYGSVRVCSRLVMHVCTCGLYLYACECV